MLDADSLAAILDPERKVPGWWDQIPTDYGYYDWVFTGPVNLHTAREHCWRMEEWLVERGCRIYRNRNNDGLTEVLRDDEGWLCYPDNHAAALSAAIERIVNER